MAKIAEHLLSNNSIRMDTVPAIRPEPAVEVMRQPIIRHRLVRLWCICCVEISEPEFSAWAMASKMEDYFWRQFLPSQLVSSLFTVSTFWYVFGTLKLNWTFFHYLNTLLQINCARRMRDIQNQSVEKSSKNEDPDFAETIELCFVNGPPRLRPWSKFVKFLVNLFICVTQLGFCCIYLVFIATNFAQVWIQLIHFEIDCLFIKFDLLVDLESLLGLQIRYLLPSIFDSGADSGDFVDHKFEIFGAVFNHCKSLDGIGHCVDTLLRIPRVAGNHWAPIRWRMEWSTALLRHSDFCLRRHCFGKWSSHLLRDFFH